MYGDKNQFCMGTGCIAEWTNTASRGAIQKMKCTLDFATFTFFSLVFFLELCALHHGSQA